MLLISAGHLVLSAHVRLKDQKLSWPPALQLYEVQPRARLTLKKRPAAAEPIGVFGSKLNTFAQECTVKVLVVCVRR